MLIRMTICLFWGSSCSCIRGVIMHRQFLWWWRPCLRLRYHLDLRFHWFSLWEREILYILKELKEGWKYLLIEEVVKLDLLLRLLIVKQYFEELEDLNFDTLLERVEHVRSESLDKWIPLRSLLFTENEGSDTRWCRELGDIHQDLNGIDLE